MSEKSFVDELITDDTQIMYIRVGGPPARRDALLRLPQL